VKAILRRRPSPALVISCIALFLSLGGVSYGVATGFIDSREIKNNTVASADVRNNQLRTFDIRNNSVRGFDIRNSTVQGRDVALNTLTGADISETSLAKVQSAAQADTATSANTANTVAGMTVRKFFAKPPNGTAPAEVFRGDGFVIEAGCTAAGAALLQLDGIPGASATNVTFSGNGDAAAGTFFGSDAALSAGDDASLMGTNVAAAGTATVSTTGGGVSTIVFGAQDSQAFSGENVCAVRGTVTAG
jgi:hypothetical protein